MTSRDETLLISSRGEIQFEWKTLIDYKNICQNLSCLLSAVDFIRILKPSAIPSHLFFTDFFTALNGEKCKMRGVLHKQLFWKKLFYNAFVVNNLKNYLSIFSKIAGPQPAIFDHKKHNIASHTHIHTHTQYTHTNIVLRSLCSNTLQKSCLVNVSELNKNLLIV